MKEKKENHITLLYWSNGTKSHYVWIKSLSRLLNDQTKHKEKKFFCERCFHGFSREDLLQKHLEYCQDVPTQRTEMVDEEIKFTNLQGRIVRKPVNANPGLKVNRSIKFSCLKMFFNAYVLRSLRLFKLKTEG